VNLKPLFEMQRKLDERIMKEKGLEGNFLPQKTLALYVELGELANESRCFKYWSTNQKPRTYAKGLEHDFFSDSIVAEWNPLLEEYADCLHLILSIGNELGYKLNDLDIYRATSNIVEQFNEIYESVTLFWITSNKDEHRGYDIYHDLFSSFINLGVSLGFTWEEIEKAYMDKNKVNHERQDNGY
jgi:dimeric dUTPase (all-alpha-NTP-PPase superfamily)